MPSTIIRVVRVIIVPYVLIDDEIVAAWYFPHRVLIEMSGKPGSAEAAVGDVGSRRPPKSAARAPAKPSDRRIDSQAIPLALVER